jgi:hypothetical protein
VTMYIFLFCFYFSLDGCFNFLLTDVQVAHSVGGASYVLSRVPRPCCFIYSFRADWDVFGTGVLFPLRHRVPTGPGAHPAYCLMGIGALSPAVKRQGREGVRSPPSTAEFKNAWSYTSTPPYVFVA